MDLFLDFETRNKKDIKEVGLDLYRQTVEPLMLAWGVGEDRPYTGGKHRPRLRSNSLWRIAQGDPMPEELRTYLNDPKVVLIAHNSQFEKSVFQFGLKMVFDETRWRDVMVLAHSWSLPSRLKDIGKALRLGPKYMKDARGDKLIRLFSVPRKDGKFNDWESHPEEWAEFESYCLQDNVSEAEIWYRLYATSPLPEIEWRGWFLDQRMNERGMPANRTMAENGLEMAKAEAEELFNQMREKTGLDNPNSATHQLLPWLQTQGYSWLSLNQNFVKAELSGARRPNYEGQMLTPLGREVLLLRQKCASKAYTKLERLTEVLGPEDRLRFQFKYGGASRTMRWSGADVQPQNLKRPIKEVKKDYQKAIDLILAKDYAAIKAGYPSVISMVASSTRMIFQAPAGKKFCISDLNAIENRVLGFIAREPAILDVFARGQDPYIAFGVYLYGRTYEDLMAEYKAGNEQLRQNCKPPVLGGGYALGGGDMYIDEFGNEVRGGLWGYALHVCGVDMPQDLAHDAVKILRRAWPNVVQFWRDVEQAMKDVAITGQPITVGEMTYVKGRREEDGTYTRAQWVPVAEPAPIGATFKFDRVKTPDGSGGNTVRIHLPSGRCLHYLNVEVEPETARFKDRATGEWREFEVTTLYYDGIEHSATLDADGARNRKSSGWTRVKTYGGKITENIDQAFSRDILLNGMFLAEEMGFEIDGVYHDEQLAEVPAIEGGLTVHDLTRCMSAAPVWAPTVPLGAEGFESQFYRK